MNEVLIALSINKGIGLHIFCAMYVFRFFIIAFLFLYPDQSVHTQEKARYKCAYRLEFLKDTLAFEYFRPEIYVVQIGDKITKGFTYRKFYLDSLKTHAPDLYRKLFNSSVKESIEAMRSTGDISHVRKNPFHHGAFASDLYKDYGRNEIRVKDNINIYSFVYTDELHPQNWDIQHDTTTILGYVSQKATCHYRGRDWIAWFTLEIPISEGPWKFYGLPGLITEIHDTKKQYCFELTGFQKVEENIEINIPRTVQKIERKKFIKSKMRKTAESITESEMVRVGLSSKSNSKTKRYDYIELDYKD